MAGIVDVSGRMLRHTLRNEDDAAAAEAAWLDDAQLLVLVRAALGLADAAQAEFNGRQSR